MDLLNHLSKSLKELNSAQYNILYIYSDLRYFGKFKSASTNKQQFLKSIIDCITLVNKTLIIPTFTYTESGIFDVQNTNTNLGALNSLVLKSYNIARSEHPIFSYAAIGEESNFVKKIGKSAFGNDSIHKRLLNKKTAFLYIGRPVSFGNTIIHYVEQLLNVDYRFEKYFPTNVYDKNKFIANNYSAFVRKKNNLKNDYSFSFEKAAGILSNQGLIQQINLDYEFSNISIMPYDETFDVLKNLLAQNESIFLKNPV